MNINNIKGYNVKLKKIDHMVVTTVIKTPIMKDNWRTGKFRYRLAGYGTDKTNMSRFVTEKNAKSLARQLGQIIEERLPNHVRRY